MNNGIIFVDGRNRIILNIKQEQVRYLFIKVNKTLSIYFIRFLQRTQH
jgi:hypothetical protein